MDATIEHVPGQDEQSWCRPTVEYQQSHLQQESSTESRSQTERKQQRIKSASRNSRSEAKELFVIKEKEEPAKNSGKVL